MPDNQVGADVRSSLESGINAQRVVHSILERSGADMVGLGRAATKIVLDALDRTDGRRLSGDEGATITRLLGQPRRDVAELRRIVLMHEQDVHGSCGSPGITWHLA